MKSRVLISAPYVMPVLDIYRRRLEEAGCELVIARVRERLTEGELLELIKDVDGIICGDDQITAKVLDAAPRLKVISKWGTGIDSIDKVAAAARGIPVRNTPDAFTEPVADTVLGYMLLFARGLARMDQDMRNGLWEKPQLFALKEKTLGIIGVGNIGRAVGRRAAAFGMRILGCDPVIPERGYLDAVGMSIVNRERLLEESDFVSLHPDLNETSRSLIDAAALKRMRSSGYLINTSRGPVVVESALAQALDERRLAGAALDVYEREPLPADSPLRRHSNCLLSPHNANSSPSSAARVHENTILNLLRVLAPAAVGPTDA
ncbi:MAG: phosphoglycerate dehydrogenase [Elusimicrobiota bacterium]|jgi:D-3-phosphoglycerate dehydrogenase